MRGWASSDQMLTESAWKFPSPCGRWELPGALGHARQLATVSHLTEADAAQAELAVHGVGATAALAAGVRTHTELGLAGSLRDKSLLRHLAYASLKGKPR